jgi:ribosomal subunit interface protein
MNIEYYHKNIDSLEGVTRDYVTEKMETLGKLTDVRDVYIEISQRKDGQFYMNVTVRSTNGFEYRAEEKSESVHACVDIIQDELRTQIRRNTEKARDLKRRGARSIKKKLTIDEKARL